MSKITKENIFVFVPTENVFHSNRYYKININMHNRNKIYTFQYKFVSFNEKTVLDL